MTGLRHWDRDRDLPARAGDADLCPPTTDEVAALVAARLLAPGAAPPQAVEWTYARWKPGVSIACGFVLHWADGTRRTIHAKRWSGGKAGAFGPRDLDALAEGWTDERLLPYAWEPAEGRLIVCSPADRALPGLARMLDNRRLVRSLRDLAAWGGGRPRAHRTSLDVLRHRPGRRAVLRVDLGLRGVDGSHTTHRLAARVLPPDEARLVIQARQACATGAVAPELLFAEARTGILIESWLPGSVPAPDDFGHAAAIGAALARLHAAPCLAGDPAGARDDTAGREAQDDALFACFPGLGSDRPWAHPPEDHSPPVWTHGDLHPDQAVLDERGAARLLDLDRLALRPAAVDLASWIADTRAAGRSAAGAATALLAAYADAGGRLPGPAELLPLVSAGLVQRAADCLRRLELGALARARDLLDLAATAAACAP